MNIQITLNGQPRELEIEPQETLAQVLRERCGLTGLKISCEVQVCGVCTVLVDGLPVSACTLLAYEARNRSVETIEGLTSAKGELHPLQQAFIDEFAFQCGFCTPGMILSAKAFLEQKQEVDEQELIAFMDGNICRCTGYLPILRAVKRAAKMMDKTVRE